MTSSTRNPDKETQRLQYLWYQGYDESKEPTASPSWEEHRDAVEGKRDGQRVIRFFNTENASDGEWIEAEEAVSLEEKR